MREMEPNFSEELDWNILYMHNSRVVSGILEKTSAEAVSGLSKKDARHIIWR
jgi:hypothetical protein